MFACYMLSSVWMVLQLLIVASLLQVIVRIINDFAIIFLLGLDSVTRSKDILNNPMCTPAK